MEESETNKSHEISGNQERMSSDYDGSFGHNLLYCGIYPDGYESKYDCPPPAPKNLEEIRQRLAQRRSSLSPTTFADSHFLDFKRTNKGPQNEGHILRYVVPVIAGPRDDRSPPGNGVKFDNMKSMDPDLMKPIPDIYYGAHPGKIDERVRDAIERYVVPSSSATRPVVPNYMVEVKTVEARPAVTARQARYDGAFGARAMHHLQNYGASTAVYDGNAYAITATYQDGYLKMYATHPAEAKDPNGPPQYYMTQLNSFALLNTAEDFRRGAAAFRNARDWTAEQRTRLITAANETAQRIPAEPASIKPGGSSRVFASTAVAADLAESDLSTDKLALDLDHGSIHKRHAKTKKNLRPEPTLDNRSIRKRPRREQPPRRNED
ncbi:MAG: hypothetical protein M1826_007538 [Phylliscum demangeonii]|nr:MAG: hypothetical protein M1826_007538 [Phylliscum demangeonii]